LRISLIAEMIGAELVAPEGGMVGDLSLEGVAPIDTACRGQLTFLTSPEYERFLDITNASAVIIKTARKDFRIPQLVHSNPYFAMAKAAQIFYRPTYSQTGISEKASVHPEAVLGAHVVIYPFAVIGKGAILGDRAVVYPNAYIGDFAQIGADTVIHANASVGERCRVGSRVIIHAGSVLGPDGFGFAPGNGELAKIPQVGIVVIEDDVEIGGLCSIDRATMGETRIGQGTKLDSHVHIAHNVKIGKNCLLCGASKIAGSTVLGDWCVLGGDASVVNNIRLGNGVRIGGKGGVTKSLDEPGDYMGFPAVPAAQWRREVVRLRRLEQMEKRLRELENAFKEFSK
jgi:UDP-3-O-[3-hydroxymyristoyl] glucosamine N-acyltransferase